MEDILIIAILLVIIGAAAWYVYKAKKSGKKCIGCPDGGCSCSSKGTGCSCGSVGGSESCCGNTEAK